MLRNTNFEPGSEAGEEARNFSFESKPQEDKIEVEGMREEHIEASRKVENINYQEEEGVNNAIINFNMDFPRIDIANKKQMKEIESHIIEAYEENPAAGKALITKLNGIVAEQLPKVDNQEQVDFVNEMAHNLEGMTMEDVEKGIAKGHSA